MKAKLHYTGIRVRDLEKSIDFYTKVLGLHEAGRNTIEVTQGTVVDMVSEDGGAPLELNWYAPGSEFDTPYSAGDGLDHLGFKVGDLDAAIAEAKKAGHPVVREIRSGTSRWVYITDPNGIWLELFA